MIVKFAKGIVKLSFYAAGVAAVAGVWDYTQQAKAAEYDYTFAQHTESLRDRFGDEADYALGALDTVKDGVQTGITWANESGMLAKVGLELPQAESDVIESMPVESASDAPELDANEAETVEIASVQPGLAPETSLFPRERTRP
jgi:hypothetical protein